jgi:hypothetical protein
VVHYGACVMDKKPEHALFEHIPQTKAVIIDNGVYREVDVYKRGQQEGQYALYRGGYIKLLGKLNTANTFGSTSHPKIRWAEIVQIP